MKNSKVAVAQINNAAMNVTGPKIPKISNYHSIEFKEDNMKMWRYYQIGEGISQEYNNLAIKPSIQLVLPYSTTDNRIPTSGKQKAAKHRDDRKLCTLLFCPEVSCIQSFEEINCLEEHLLSGEHTIAKEMSTLDKIKKSFVEKMKQTSQHHMPLKTPVECLNQSGSGTSKLYKDFFQEQGWALPVRSNFRYIYRQPKKIPV